MDITVNSWKESVRYVKNDIVKVEEILSVVDWDISSTVPVYMMPLGSINARDDLMVRAFVKKENPSDSLDDPTQALIYSTAAAGGYSKVDQATSNAVGVGLSFFDAGSAHLGSIDLHESIKIVSSDEISSKEWFLMEKFVPASCMPPGTAQIKIVLFACGYLRGTFKFKEINASNAYPYFYCTTKHLSTSSNSPTTTSTNWTQKFNWKASYGSSVDFKGDNYSTTKEEGERFDVSKGLNALPMRMNISFNERDDRESKAIIHFLQEKYFQYEGIYNLNYLGERNELSEVGAFDFTLTRPYKTSQKVVCREFSQDLDFRNNNNITAVFENLYASETSVVSSFDGYNSRLDFLSYLKLSGGSAPYSKGFVKDVPITLDIYTATDANGGVEPSGGAEDCQSFGLFFPPGVSEITPTDPATGGDRVFLFQNYRKVKLSSTITKSSTTVTITPLESFSVSSSQDRFPVLIPCVGGQSSMYIEEPDEILWYPWLGLRSFPFKASSSQDIPQAPRHVNESFTSYYKKLYKAGPNQNLLQLSVSFDYRTEREAKEILLFLEQHLGYKRFRFQLPRPYTKGDTAAATLAEKRISMFFCPEWKHSVVFKNCHRIEAKFIETPSGVTQEPFDIYALPADSFPPCIASAYYPNLVKYEICPRTSSALAKLGCEFSGSNLTVTIRAADIMICIDRSCSMGGNRMALANKVARQIIGTHKQCPIEEGRCEDQDFTYASEFSQISPSEIVPPYSAANLTNKDLEDNTGYKMEWMDRFAIKIDERRVNLGIIYYTGGASTSISLDGSTAAGVKPNSYSKKKLMSVLYARSTNGTAYGPAMDHAINSFHGSDRNYFLDDRILIFISDGLPGDGKTGITKADSLRNPGELSERLRTSSRAGYVKKVNDWIQEEKNSGKGEEDAIQSVYNRGYDASYTSLEATPNWVKEDQPTTTFAVGIGLSESKLVNMGSVLGDKRLFFRSDQASQLIKLVNIIINMTEDSGSQNYFSVTVSNCGPKPIKINNTLVRFKSDKDAPLWTVKRTPGVHVQTTPPEDSFARASNVLLEDAGASISDPEDNTGGQYIDDPTAPYTPDPDQLVNWKWRNGNVVAPDGAILQLWRNCKRYDVDNPDGGTTKVDPNIAADWGSNEGADNIGVFAKDKFVRAFFPYADSSDPIEGVNEPTLEIQDLNIGNVHTSNPWGDYNHLPELQPGESLDLFFVAISNRLFGTLEEIQLVFDTEDVPKSSQKTECYANISFNLWTEITKRKREGTFKTLEPVIPEPEPEPEPEPVPPAPTAPDPGPDPGPLPVPPDDPCVTWKRKSNPCHYRGCYTHGSTQGNLFQYTDIPSAPFLGGPPMPPHGNEERVICLTQLSLEGWSPFFEEKYAKWLKDCKPTYSLLPGNVGPIQSTSTKEKGVCEVLAQRNYLATWPGLVTLQGKQYAQNPLYCYYEGRGQDCSKPFGLIARAQAGPGKFSARANPYICSKDTASTRGTAGWLTPCLVATHPGNMATWDLGIQPRWEETPAARNIAVFWIARCDQLNTLPEWEGLRLRLVLELNGKISIGMYPDGISPLGSQYLAPPAGGSHCAGIAGTDYEIMDLNDPSKVAYGENVIFGNEVDMFGNIGGISVQATDQWRNW